MNIKTKKIEYSLFLAAVLIFCFIVNIKFTQAFTLFGYECCVFTDGYVIPVTDTFPESDCRGILGYQGATHSACPSYAHIFSIPGCCVNNSGGGGCQYLSQNYSPSDCIKSGGSYNNAKDCDSIETCSPTPKVTPSSPSDYTPMEKIPGFPANSGDYVQYVLAIHKFGIWTIGIAALLMIMIGGFMYITSAGNNASMEKAKGIITDAIIGIIMALAAYLLLYVINPELVKIKTISLSGTSIPGSTPGIPGTPSVSCPNVDSMKNRLASGGSVCDNQNCSSSNSDCKNKIQQYASIIANNTSSAEEAKYIKAIICRESGGDASAHASDGGCGLMQVTDSAWASSCPSSILDPEANIKKGIQLFREKESAASYSYGSGITKEEMAMAAYNCCANGDNPNAQSNSCQSSDGWPSIPKWACPINPGSGTFNMCAVENYACDVNACAKTF